MGAATARPITGGCASGDEEVARVYHP